MKFQGAVIEEQGIKFAVVIVKEDVFGSKTKPKQTVAALRDIFPDIPIILMAQDSEGNPTYYGRTDIVRFLTELDLKEIPWKEFTLDMEVG